MGGLSNCVMYPTCGRVYATSPMYSSLVIGKSVPGIDAGFASPFVLSVLGSSSEYRYYSVHNYSVMV